MANSEAPAVPISLQRRSQRLLLRVPIEVRRTSAAGQHITEETGTLAINAHGALINLKAPVSESDKLVVKNLKTGEEQPCRIVYVGPTEVGSTQVGIEFVQPSPQMWGIAFPPQDWAAARTAPAASKVPPAKPRR
jgi:hypothetical protein